MERKPVFDRAEHQIACIGGWLVFAIGSAYPLWAFLWAVSRNVGPGACGNGYGQLDVGAATRGLHRLQPELEEVA